MNHDDARVAAEATLVPNEHLDTVLRDLAHHDATLTPPVSLERRTMAAYDAWRLAEPDAGARVRSTWVAPAALAAAALLLAVVLAPDWRSDRATLVPATGAAAVSPAAVAPPRAVVVGGQPTGDRGATAGADPRVSHRTVAVIPGEPRRQSPPQSQASGQPQRLETLRFMRLGPRPDDDGAGAFEVSRVQVPRRVLIDLGLLADGRQGDEPVAADVMFGEDGVARAIRLAPAARRIP